MARTRTTLLGNDADAVPRRLVILLSILVLLGLASTGAAVINAKATNNASQADVERNVLLTQRLTELTEQLKNKQAGDSASSVKFREDTRLLILAICANTENAARKVGAMAQACPDVLTNP